jgi:hypothetical protein
MPNEFHVTLTHARLRAEQGDRSGARAILARLLADDPGNLAARKLLLQLDVQPDTEHEPERDEPAGARQPADAESLGARFRSALGEAGPQGDEERAGKLRRWLRRIGGRP